MIINTLKMTPLFKTSKLNRLKEAVHQVFRHPSLAVSDARTRVTLALMATPPPSKHQAQIQSLRELMAKHGTSGWERAWFVLRSRLEMSDAEMSLILGKQV